MISSKLLKAKFIKRKLPEGECQEFQEQSEQSEQKKKNTAMKYSTVTRIIIITLFIVAHVTQAYHIAVWRSFVSICKIYVTDCNGKVIRNDGWEDCNGSPVIIPIWDEAPDLYCVHVYPRTKPKDNRYIPITNNDTCIKLDGDLRSWSMKSIPPDKCFAE
ncbi:hypothetical protein Glove_198g54 [Diversispora epigaea]|uniref:Uncharacterized protein n=1 Tax=Diversispora epigaea TaxID=1348612 RepID=A0A397ITI1_9GLOM|nr:hypothetical protein Glove_198g54 [Diversispora epigaea]